MSEPQTTNDDSFNSSFFTETSERDYKFSKCQTEGHIEEKCYYYHEEKDMLMC